MGKRYERAIKNIKMKEAAIKIGKHVNLTFRQGTTIKKDVPFCNHQISKNEKTEHVLGQGSEETALSLLLMKV